MARIIIADDDPICGELVAGVMLNAGHAAGRIENGLDAWHVMRRRPPSLAIVDCMMPGMSGPQLVRRMRTDDALCRVPVLILTARQSEQDEDIAYSAGADDYLRKPFDLDELAGRVEALLLRAASRPGGSVLAV